MWFAASAAAQTGAPQRDRPVSGQPETVVPIDLTGDRLQTLERWTKNYEEWKAWTARYRKGQEPGWFSAPKPRPAPAPPDWLPNACALLGDEQGVIGDGCRAYRDLLQRDEATRVVTEQIAQTRARQEAPRNTIWWEHIHVDALWPMTQVGTNAYGVAGMHTTLQLSRRFQIFLAPGVMMMRLPTADGHERWSPATHWGFSYRLLDFVFPGTHRPSRLHLNIARVWLLEGNRLPTAGEIYLAGFSLTFKDRGDDPGPDHTGDPASSGARGSLRSGIPR
jgi:hypothetical protein